MFGSSAVEKVLVQWYRKNFTFGWAKIKKETQERKTTKYPIPLICQKLAGQLPTLPTHFLCPCKLCLGFGFGVDAMVMVHAICSYKQGSYKQD